MEEGDPLGATLDEQFVVISVQKNSLAEGKLEVGDKILNVNERVPRDIKHLYVLFNVAAREGKASIRVERNTNRATELDVHNQIPPNRAKFVKRREGFLYKLISIVYQRQSKLGLAIKHHQNRVFVTRCEPGSLSARALQVMDQILDVDGLPVTDALVTSDAIRDAFRNKGYFTAVIARPTTDEAREWSRSHFEQPQPKPIASTSDEPSVQMSSDVAAIVKSEVLRLNNNTSSPAKSNIIVAPGTRLENNVNINEHATEVPIASDVPESRLKSLVHIGPQFSVAEEQKQ